VVTVPSNSIDVELLGITSKFDSVDFESWVSGFSFSLGDSMIVFVVGIVPFSRDSFLKNSSESRLGPSNIIVLRKIPKNTEPKIEVVIIKIDLADNYHLVLYSYL